MSKSRQKNDKIDVGYGNLYNEQYNLANSRGVLCESWLVFLYLESPMLLYSRSRLFKSQKMLPTQGYKQIPEIVKNGKRLS